MWNARIIHKSFRSVLFRQWLPVTQGIYHNKNNVTTIIQPQIQIKKTMYRDKSKKTKFPPRECWIKATCLHFSLNKISRASGCVKERPNQVHFIWDCPILLFLKKPLAHYLANSLRVCINWKGLSRVSKALRLTYIYMSL